MVNWPSFTSTPIGTGSATAMAVCVTLQCFPLEVDIEISKSELPSPHSEGYVSIIYYNCTSREDSQSRLVKGHRVIVMLYSLLSDRLWSLAARFI